MGFWRLGLPLTAFLAAALHPAWSPIDPVRFLAPKPPTLVGDLALNDRLTSAHKAFAGKVQGPEDVIRDSYGNLYCSNEDGTIRELWKDGTVTVWAHTGGRPLGLAWEEEGECMVVCDAYKGLLSVNSSGHVEVLSTESEGIQFRFLNDLVISSDGSVYFTDSSSKFGLHRSSWEVLEGRANGRLLRYNPKTRRTETLLSGLVFPNGVALSQDEDFLLIAETSRYRIQKYLLKGPKAGTSEVFVENLPGLPDDVHLGDDGLFWVGFVLPRQRRLDFIHKLPFVKSLVTRFPRRIWDRNTEMGMVMSLTGEGKPVDFFTNSDGNLLKRISTAKRWDNELVMGTLEGDGLAVLNMRP